MFKKGKVNNHHNLSEDLAEIQVKEENHEQHPYPMKYTKTKRINKQQLHNKANIQIKQQRKKVHQFRYGLIDKEHIHQIDHNHHIDTHQIDNQQTLIDIYIRKRKQEIAAKQNSKQSIHIEGSEVLKMQKQYLKQSQNSRNMDYNLEHIHCKLQTIAKQALRTQIEIRNAYLKDLLQNEHQRMQYASKKELKIIRQEKQRQEKQLISKYRTQGRRHYIQQIQNSIILGT